MNPKKKNQDSYDKKNEKPNFGGFVLRIGFSFTILINTNITNSA